MGKTSNWFNLVNGPHIVPIRQIKDWQSLRSKIGHQSAHIEKTESK